MRRNIYQYLQEWSKQEKRKPLVIRGARQVGKTFAVNNFPTKHKVVYLNLEKNEDRDLFRTVRDAKSFLSDLELFKQTTVVPGETIVFIDEIQASANAMKQLRFFYEEIPSLHIVAAGSLLELKLQEKSFEIPVGRVEYRYLFAMDFDEFVDALGNRQTYEYLRNLDADGQISEIAHATFLKQYEEFSLIGGLPEVVASYVSHRKYEALTPVYSSLMASFVDDVYKYSTTAASEQLSFLLANAPKYSGSTITYNKFAGSTYSSRQMSQSFRKLEKALLFTLVRPTKNVIAPVEANYKASPKLIFLDHGLANFASGGPIVPGARLGHMFKGRIAEQRVGASLWRQSKQADIPLHYWNRLKKGSSAEIDFLLSIQGQVVPIEVKSAATGRLRSLHQFMEQSDMNLAVKVSASNYNSEQVETPNGKKYTLVNIPHYLSFRLVELVNDLLR